MELVKIYQGNVIDARELWQFLEIKTPFNDWVRRSILKHFKEDVDFYANLRKSTGGRPSKEYFLTIDTAKKLAMMAKTPKGDQARDYFIQCEKTLLALASNKRLEAFLKLETTKEKLLQNIENIGGTEADYIQIDEEGRKVFFNGQLIPDEELPILFLKGRDFATEMTNEGFKKGLEEVSSIEELNKRNHLDVRSIMELNTGILPEQLKREEDIRKLLGKDSKEE